MERQDTYCRWIEGECSVFTRTLSCERKIQPVPDDPSELLVHLLINAETGHVENGVRAAAKALGHSTEREVVSLKKRVLSAAARPKIGQAAKKR